MFTRRTCGKITWIDMECPTREELQAVMAEFDIDTRVEEEIVTPTLYPIVVAFPKYVYMILHFPTASMTGGAKNQEVDFIVGKNFLITVRYEVIESIHNLQRVFEAEELLGMPANDTTAAALLERIMRRLYGAIRQEAEHIATILERIERDIFSGKERKAVRSISEANRVLLRFDTTLDRHAESLDVFLRELEEPAFFGKSFATNAAHIRAHRTHVDALVGSYKAVASELRQTNDSLLNTSQNEVMKILTIMAFVTFPLTLISSIFGMNTEYLPLVGLPGDFWYVIGIMVTMTVSFFTFFRLKRWL